MQDIPDLEAIEDAARQLEVVPYALWTDEMRAEFDALVEDALRTLAKLQALGRIKLVRTADGRLEAEVLDRVRH
jgi:hypothetical protein